MKLKYLLLSVVLILTACQSGTSPKDGDLKLGIVTGKFQTVSVGAEALPEPIVGRLVRTPSGQVAWHQVPSKVGSAFLDFLVPKAFASDTFVVQGAPIAGAAVCLNEDSPLVPFSRCVTTGSDGYATMFAKPGTRLGEQRGEIRGVIDGQALVFDTIIVEVTPGPATYFRTHDTHYVTGNAPVLLSKLVMYATDEFDNRLSLDEVEVTANPAEMSREGDTLRFSTFSGVVELVLQLQDLVDTTFIVVYPDLTLAQIEAEGMCSEVSTQDWVFLYDSIQVSLNADSIQLLPTDDPPSFAVHESSRYRLYFSGYEIRFSPGPVVTRDSVSLSLAPVEAYLVLDTLHLRGRWLRDPTVLTPLVPHVLSPSAGGLEYTSISALCGYHPNYVPYGAGYSRIRIQKAGGS